MAAMAVRGIHGVAARVAGPFRGAGFRRAASRAPAASGGSRAPASGSASRAPAALASAAGRAPGRGGVAATAAAGSAPGATAASIPLFGGSGLDRLADKREDAAWLAAAAADPSSLAVIIQKGQALVKEGRAATVPLAEAAAARAAAAGASSLLPPLLLGRRADAPKRILFALECDGGAELPAALLAAAGPGATLKDLRRAGPLMDSPADASLLALAAGMVNWNRATKHCPKCGTATLFAGAGWRRRCPACGSSEAAVAGSDSRGSVFPRLDPAIIAVVECTVPASGAGGAEETYCLLGSNAKWAHARYSCLAGFAETGETLEEAVAREVLEEAGVVVEPGSVEYVTSQPWPFPQSLMIGFRARAAPVLGPDGAWRPPVAQGDADEIADARWFRRAWLAAASRDVDAAAAAAGGAAPPMSGSLDAAAAAPPAAWGPAVSSSPALLAEQPDLLGFGLPGRTSLGRILIDRFLERGAGAREAREGL